MSSVLEIHFLIKHGYNIHLLLMEMIQTYDTEEKSPDPPPQKKSPLFCNKYSGHSGIEIYLDLTPLQSENLEILNSSSMNVWNCMLLIAY